MKIRRVKNIMLPLDEYATVKEDATLQDAIRALYDAQTEQEEGRYKHKAILVYNSAGTDIVGKLSQLDILRVLEPKYRQIGANDPLATFGLSRFGLSPDFLKSLVSSYKLWEQPLEALVASAATLTVSDFMYKPSDGEFVDEESSLADAIHQLIMGRHQSLLVMKDNKITGILRLADIFSVICDLILTQNCNNV